MIDTLGIPYTHAKQPEAQTLLNPDAAAPFDAIFFYDMPGIDFQMGGKAPNFPAPSPELKQGLEALCESGKPLLFLHHALAGWPAWEKYAEIMGGRFHYMPATLRNESYPDSGYILDADYEVEVAARDHPICAGLPRRFTTCDELYQCPVFEEDVTPLFTAQPHYTDEDYFAAAPAATDMKINHRPANWSHPSASPLWGWEKTHKNSRIVTILGGDGPAAYANPYFRQLLKNAVQWLASPE
ncbi:MAG: ThuA domain-containing protein [Alphaproteobacteria bacterium]